jgi:hypothetical protein
MKIQIPNLLAILTLAASTFGLAASPAAQGLNGPTSQEQAASIYLKAATFVPTRGEAPSLPVGLAIADYAQNQRGYYLVQFRGPIEQGWKDQLASLGAEILDYVPDYAFKVRMNPGEARQAMQLKEVAWVGLFQPAYKLSPDLRRGGTQLYTVRIERGADAGPMAAAMAQTGAQILAQEGDSLLVAADAAQLDALANVLDVAWVQNFTFREKHNEYGAGVIMGANSANARGYDGSTQIAAVADTGLGDGTTAGAHPDIPASRIVAIYNWTAADSQFCYDVIPDGAKDVDSGHGTHVAVSVLGDGGASGEGKGTAPAARLVFQAVEEYVNVYGFCADPDSYYLIGIPSDIKKLFQQAYNAGARIHSNSWGSDAKGDYTLDSANADSFIWTNKAMVITFSAGNSGTDANADGVVDNDSTGSPATAKNVITVGASENDRRDQQGNPHYECDTGLTYTSHDAYQTGQTCSSMGGNQVNFLGTWGQRYPTQFPAEPLASDVTAGNQEQMASWSSRGPTDDGRIKPDVVAPGTWIFSGYSGLYQEGYGDPVNPQNGVYQWDGWGMPRNIAYKGMGGTSMSNPLAAGAATVVRDFYQKAHGVSASAALVKATLINSAVDLADENNDGVNDNDFPIPNNHEGWGRVNVNNATDGSHQFVENTTGLSTGGSATYQFNIGAGGSPFKVTLVWSDYPSTETASVNLVNNLDLTVTAPGGAVYRGNVFSGGWSQTGGSADNRNNVENVYAQSAAAGTWTVQVSGFNVPNGPQPFALVVDGSFGATPTPPSPTPTSEPTLTPTHTPVPTNTPTLTPTLPPTDTGFRSPTANAAQTSQAGDNNGFETSASNAHTDNGLFAVDTNSGTGSSTSCTHSSKDKHHFGYYGFTFPAGATIKGIEVRLDAKVDSTSGAPKMCVQLSGDGGVTWTTTKSTTTLSTSEVTKILGGATDTWGRTWSAANFSDAAFVVRVMNVASSTARDFALDWVAVKVHYQP